MLPVFVLNGIFNRNDVFGVAPVYLIDDRSERGCLARACGTTDEHKAVRNPAERENTGGKVQLRKSGRPRS